MSRFDATRKKAGHPTDAEDGSRVRRWVRRLTDAIPFAARMTRAEEALLAEQSAGREALVLARSRSRVDVGKWFTQGRVWIACYRGEAVAWAAGLVPFVQRMSPADVAAAAYNPLTGELVLAPAAGLQVRRLRMSPVDGGRILSWVRESRMSDHRIHKQGD